MTEYIEYTLNGVEYVDFMINGIVHTSTIAAGTLPHGPYDHPYTPPVIRPHTFPLF